jgi:hypothetical protein
VPIKLTKSVMYELDDQINIIRKTMDIDIRWRVRTHHKSDYRRQDK